MKKYKRDGIGKMVFEDGGSYEGVWVNDIKHGKATYTWPNGSKFEGIFKNGNMTTG
jgi:radial spoke head protein 1